MKNNLLFLAITLLLFGFSACQKDSTDPTQTSGTGATGRAAVTPFKGSYTTHPEVVSVENGILTLSIPGEGKATHLGKSTWYADSWVDTNQFPFV